MSAFMRSFISSCAQRWNMSLTNMRLLVHVWTKGGPPPALAIAGCPSVYRDHQPSSDNKETADSFLDSIFDGILLAVPKKRRSLERRWLRKHQYIGYMEQADRKSNIVPCLECGNYKEKGHLCEHCYSKVREETKKMQAQMGDELQFNVPRRETEFVYEGETASSESNHVVKMNKSRPGWFPRRLLNKTGS